MKPEDPYVPFLTTSERHYIDELRAEIEHINTKVLGDNLIDHDLVEACGCELVDIGNKIIRMMRGSPNKTPLEFEI